MIGTLTVGTIWDKPLDKVRIYIGRSSKFGSPLGNPFIINGSVSRDEACDAYENYLMEQMNQGNKQVINEMNRIAKLVQSGEDVLLQCYCKHKDLRCHGDFIKQVIDDALTHKVPD